MYNPIKPFEVHLVFNNEKGVSSSVQDQILGLSGKDKDDTNQYYLQIALRQMFKEKTVLVLVMRDGVLLAAATLSITTNFSGSKVGTITNLIGEEEDLRDEEFFLYFMEKIIEKVKEKKLQQISIIFQDTPPQIEGVTLSHFKIEKDFPTIFKILP